MGNLFDRKQGGPVEFTPDEVVRTARWIYSGLVAGLIVFGAIVALILLGGGTPAGIVRMPNQFLGYGSTVFLLIALLIAPKVRSTAWGTSVGNHDVPMMVQVRAYTNGVVLYAVIIAGSGLFGCLSALFDGLPFLALPVLAVGGLLAGWPKRSHFRGPLDNPYRETVVPSTDPYRVAAAGNLTEAEERRSEHDRSSPQDAETRK